MLTDTTISDGRTVTLDLEPMSADQQKALATAVADFLIRSGRIHAGAAPNPAQLVQFLSEAADLAAEQALPVDPESVTLFEARTNRGVLRGDDHYVSTPDDFLTKREIDGVFDEGCNAIRKLEEAVADDPDLAEAAATLLNRAYWFGQGRCAPFHVTQRS